LAGPTAQVHPRSTTPTILMNSSAKAPDLLEKDDEEPYQRF
jgi:hypothetical protein